MTRPQLDPTVIASIDRTFAEATEKLDTMLSTMAASTLAARQSGEYAKLDSIAFYDLYRAIVSLMPPQTVPYLAAAASIRLLQLQIGEGDDDDDDSLE